MPDGATLSPRMAGEMIGIHEDTVKRWIKAGRLTAIRTSPGQHGRWRLRRSDVEAFIRAIETGKQPEVEASA